MGTNKSPETILSPSEKETHDNLHLNCRQTQNVKTRMPLIEEKKFSKDQIKSAFDEINEAFPAFKDA